MSDEDTITIPRQMLKQAVRYAYEEGQWNAEYGGMTGYPHGEVRSPMTLGDTHFNIEKGLDAGNKILRRPAEIKEY
jgi:hypothetical protein